MAKREVIGAGVVVSADGLVICGLGLVPPQIPDEMMKDFKIILPGADQGEDLELDAVFQGRDERSNLAFIKAKDSRQWTPLKFEAVPINIGDRVMSVGMLPKSGGYKSYFLEAAVSSKLNGPVPQIFVSGEGLCAFGSPVFDAQGRAIGFINAQPEQTVMLNDPRQPLGSMMEPSRLFTPTDDFLPGLNEPPTADHPLRIPNLGVGQLAGLDKEVAEYFNLKGQPAVQIGDVLQGKAADKAGLKKGDIIVKLNGKPLERGDTPDETWRIFARNLMRMHVGDKVTLSVMVERDKPLKEVTVTLEERPKQRNKAQRYYAEDLGFTTRELVFEDTYERKLPADAPGVVVAFIRPNSSASTARIGPDDLITQINATPVKDLDQFKTEYEAFRKSKPHDAVVLEVIRQGNTQVIRIEPPQ
jgi:serine protease Do